MRRYATWALGQRVPVAVASLTLETDGAETGFLLIRGPLETDKWAG
jgi:hypothetical protein